MATLYTFAANAELQSYTPVLIYFCVKPRAHTRYTIERCEGVYIFFFVRPSLWREVWRLSATKAHLIQAVALA